MNCSADRITLSVSSEVLKEIYSDTKACLFVGGPIGERKHNDFCQGENCMVTESLIL